MSPTIRKVLSPLPARETLHRRTSPFGRGRAATLVSRTGEGADIELNTGALTRRRDAGAVRSRRERWGVAIQDSVLFLLCACAIAGCAQQGGGLLQPTPKQIISGKNTIVPSSAALSMEATNFCNAQAQVDYAGLVLYCEGKTPALPLSISTNYQTEASQFSCQVYGYTNSSNQLIVPATVMLGNCPTGAAPAPVTAPSGASTAAAH